MKKFIFLTTVIVGTIMFSTTIFPQEYEIQIGDGSKNSPPPYTNATKILLFLL
jgi:hypothetical protein